MITYSQIENRLSIDDKLYLLQSSAVREDNDFTNILNKIHPVPESIIEIGTYRGISTIVLASITKKVYTFDVVYQSVTEYLWESFKVRDKIEYVVLDAYLDGYDIGSLKEIGIHKLINKGIDHDVANKLIDRYLINHKVEADLVFIDGKHQLDLVKENFKIAQRFGRILFHDITYNYPGVIDFIKSIGAKIINGFGYYESSYNK